MSNQLNCNLWLLFIIANFAIGCTTNEATSKYKSSEDSIAIAREVDSVIRQVSIKGTYDTYNIDSNQFTGLDSSRLLKQYNILKSKFTSAPDEFSDITYYTPKLFGKYYPNRSNLYAETNNTGWIVLRSNYHADDWLFHSYVQVKVGEHQETTSVVPTYDSDNRHDNNSNGVWENIAYPQSDNHIIDLIADNVDERVVIRFQGDQYYHDATLSKSDKMAIKDTRDLRLAIIEAKARGIKLPQ